MAAGALNMTARALNMPVRGRNVSVSVEKVSAGGLQMAARVKIIGAAHLGLTVPKLFSSACAFFLAASALQTQNNHMKTLARVGAVLSFIFCLLGGLWILSRASFSSQDDVLATAIGFYFVGKAFFVGPMLWLAAGRQPESK